MDYLQFFNLHAEPFTHAPLSEFYFASRQHSDALARLTYAVRSKKGLALLVGDVGRGKSTLARRLLDSLPEAEFEAAMLVVVHAAAGPKWLLKRLAVQLSVDQPADEPLALVGQIYHRLVEIHEQGRHAVVLIDEAQMLNSRELMEEFRGLLNLEVPGHKLITFVFFGLPELEDNLKLDPPLSQRVALRYELTALNAAETASYVTYRLEKAGANRPFFDPDGLLAVHRFSRGVPRVINTLCDNTLLEMFFAQRLVADGALVAEVANNLHLGTLDAASVAAPVPPSHPGAAASSAEVADMDPDAYLKPFDEPNALSHLDVFPNDAFGGEPADRRVGNVDAMARPLPAGYPAGYTSESHNLADDLAARVAAEPLDGPLLSVAEQGVELPGNGWEGVQPVGAVLGNDIAAPAAALPAKQPPRPAPGSRVSSKTANILAEVDDFLEELKTRKKG